MQQWSGASRLAEAVLPLSNLLAPCSQIDFGMNCCGRLEQTLLDTVLGGPSVAGEGCRLGCAAAAGTCCCPVTGRLPSRVATLMAGAGPVQGSP